MRSRLLAIVAFSAFTLPPTGAAVAADAAALAVDGSAGYIVTLGAGAEFGPRFPAAKRYSFSPAPSFDIRKAGEAEGFSAPNDGLDYALIDTSRLSFGPVANIRWGRRRAEMSKDMRSVGTTPTVLEVGGFTDYWLAPDTLRTRVELRHGVSANDGLVADFSADLVQQFGPVRISGGPRLTAASGGVNDRLFGISDSDALSSNSALSSFRANGGVQSVGLNLATKHDLTAATAVTAYGQYDRLLGDAAKSPITRKFGSPDQFTVGVGLQHAFSFGQ